MQGLGHAGLAFFVEFHKQLCSGFLLYLLPSTKCLLRGVHVEFSI